MGEVSLEKGRWAMLLPNMVIIFSLWLSCDDECDNRDCACGYDDMYSGDKGALKKKRGGGIGPKKKVVIAVEVNVAVAQVQRQKRKLVTIVAGLESEPDLKVHMCLNLSICLSLYMSVCLSLFICLSISL